MTGKTNSISKRFGLISAIALLAACASVPALIATAQQTPAAPDTYIHAGRLLADPASGRVLTQQTILVRDGKIVSITAGYTSAPRGAKVVDLKSSFVLPGLIDSHVHLDSDRAGNEGLLAGLTESPALHAFEAEMNGRKTLGAGFTTVRNLGDGEGVVMALRDAVNRGWVVGPRILDAAMSISTTSGHMDGRLGLDEELHPTIGTENLCDGVEECRKAVRRQVGRGADVIKIATTGGVNSRIGAGLGAQMFDDEAKAIVDTARLYGKKVAVHAHGADGVAVALRAGAHSIEHGTLMDDEVIQLMRRTGAYYVPTRSTVNGYLERIAANPNAYPPDVRKKIDFRISITG